MLANVSTPKLLFALAVVLFALAHPLAAQNRNATISGTVTDSATGLPLGDVIVQIDGSSRATRTDSSGHYSLAIHPGVTTVVIMRLAYSPVTRSGILVTEAGPNVADFKMALNRLVLTVVVTTGISAPGSGGNVPLMCTDCCPDADLHVRPLHPLEILESKVSEMKVQAPPLSQPVIVLFPPRLRTIRR